MGKKKVVSTPNAPKFPLNNLISGVYRQNSPTFSFFFQTCNRRGAFSPVRSSQQAIFPNGILLCSIWLSFHKLAEHFQKLNLVFHKNTAIFSILAVPSCILRSTMSKADSLQAAN